jgi:hypothetical protein
MKEKRELAGLAIMYSNQDNKDGKMGERFLRMYIIAVGVGKGGRGTWFGHTWTGPGNSSDFSDFNNKHSIR